MTDKLSQSVTLMDGSMGEELADRGFSTRDGLWSAGALIDHPEQVALLHRDYLDAGAKVITTNTYSTIPSYLDKQGQGGRMRELTRRAVHIARRTLEAYPHGTSRYLAGCLPPLDESYRPDLVPPSHEAIPIYRELIDCMVQDVDLFLAETMSSIDEASHVATALRAHPSASKKDWIIAFTTNDSDGTHLRSGEPVSAAIRAISRHAPIAILFNCATPESIVSAIDAAHSMTRTPVGGYPNRFKPVPMGWTLDDEQEIIRDEGLTVNAFVDWSARFIDAGASFVGGCCGIGPAYIRALREHLDTKNEGDGGRGKPRKLVQKITTVNELPSAG